MLREENRKKIATTEKKMDRYKKKWQKTDQKLSTQRLVHQRVMGGGLWVGRRF